jgi:hypothetical protein
MEGVIEDDWEEGPTGVSLLDSPQLKKGTPLKRWRFSFDVEAVDSKRRCC